MTKTLVAYATKHGSTAEIASAIADKLRSYGVDTDFRAAREVSDLAPYQAVVLGAGVYMGRWHGEALDFLKRFEAPLRARPVWLFSSGPTGGTPKAEEALAAALKSQGPPPGQARKWADRIGVLSHATFGGKVGDGVGGIFERWVPKGDWRDFGAISEWATGIAEASRIDPVTPRGQADRAILETSAIVA
jgi:menaquinone-dependent protoporphyrinogen oxidase